MRTALVAFAAFLAMAPQAAHAALTLTCTAGDFGTVSTQATISGTNTLSMDTAGAITYAPTLSGSATGTTITCDIQGSSNGNKPVDVYCDASGTITNSGGCCGTADRSVSAFTVTGIGKSTLNPTACAGINTLAGTFNVVGAQGGTLKLGMTMDATHAMIGGTYALSNYGGVQAVRVKVIDNNNNSVTTTADFHVVFDSLLGFSSTGNLDYGTVGIAGPVGSGSHVDLGTNGTAVYTGNFTNGGGTTVAGQVTVNNVQNGVTLEVRCDTTATMGDGSGNTIQVTGLKVARKGSTGTYAGAGVACAGAGAASPATTMVFNAGTADQFFFGGKLDGGTASAGFGNTGTYSSATGGTYATVNVINQ